MKLEGELARAKDALVVAKEARVVAKEARRKVESEAARLEVDRTSLLLKLGTVKDEVSSLPSQSGKDKEAMEKEYHMDLKVIFTYEHGCCVFKHDICGDRLEVLIHLGQVGVRNQQNLYPRIPTTDIAKLLLYSGSRVKHRDGFSS